MRYYTFAYEQFPSFERLLRPPFRVLARVPGIIAMLEFDNDNLALMQSILAENDSVCWVCDEKRRRYKISKNGIERGNRPRAWPGARGRYLREMRRKRRWDAQDKLFCESVTRPTTIPNGRTPLFFLLKRYIYAKPGWEHPFRYSLRSPKGGGDLPLVVYLHGAGAGGTNGMKPLLHYALTVPRVRQKYHLLVPQEGLFDIYGEEFSDALGEVIAGIPNVDRSRIYIVGMSMGGCGAIIECSRHPDRYAAAVPTVSWLFNLRAGKKTRSAMADPLDDKAYDALAKTPMWLTYSRLEQRLNEQLCEALRIRNAELRQTCIKLRGMFGHVIAPLVFSLTKPWAKWMFAHRKEGA